MMEMMTTMPNPADTYIVFAPGESVDATVGGFAAELTVDIAPFGPMPIRVESDSDGTVLAVALFSGDYGVGTDYATAIAALGGAVRRYHAFLLKEGIDHLSVRLQEHLSFLESQLARGGGGGTL